MKGFHSRELRELRRQTISPAAGNRVSGANTTAAAGVAGEPITRRGEDGRGRDLFIPDVDPLDDDRFYLGDAPIEPTEL
jgi:hypothetical protein